jgi:hypothetical protein
MSERGEATGKRTVDLASANNTNLWFGGWFGKNLRPRDAQSPEIKWVQQFYFAKLGEVVIDQLSPPASEKLEELEP